MRELAETGHTTVRGLGLSSSELDRISAVNLLEDIQSFGGRSLLVGVSPTGAIAAGLRKLAARLEELGGEVTLESVQDPLEAPLGDYYYRNVGAVARRYPARRSIRRLAALTVSWALAASGRDLGCRRMKQFPLFVPSPDGHVAAVVTVPEGDPSGVVLLLAGTGRHNVIGSTMSALLSDRLATHRLASVRLDYEGVGDSPGIVSTWSPVRRRRRIRAGSGRARRGERRARGESFRLRRHVLRQPCRARAHRGRCLRGRGLPRPAAPRTSRCTGPAGGRGKGAVLALLRSNRVSRRLIVEPLREAGGEARAAGALREAASRTSTVSGSCSSTDATRRRTTTAPQVRRSIEEAVAALPDEQRARFELRMLSSGPLTTFDGLAHADQEAILDAVVPFVLQCFEGTTAAPLDSRPDRRTMREAALLKSSGSPCGKSCDGCCLPVDSFG